METTSITTSLSPEQLAARLSTVDEHIRCENSHDLEGVIRTFGDIARYDDEPWAAHYEGIEGVRSFYEQLMKALPDLEIDVKQRHIAQETVILEVVIRGTHLGTWRGLPATGRKIEFPLCGIYTFNPDGHLAGEKIYYDRGSVLKQIGLFREPRSAIGQMAAVLAHPLTIANAYIRKLTRH